MILICPNCNSHFKTSLAAFGREGRNVKCSACGEVWWQEPSLDDVAKLIVEEDIAAVEKVEPEKQDDLEVSSQPEITAEDFAQNAQERRQEFERQEGRSLAKRVAAALFLIVFVYLLAAHASIMKAHMGMQGFYKIFGLHMKVPDNLTLMFEGVQAEKVGDEILVSGRIVNLSSENWALPLIEVSVFKPGYTPDGQAHDEVLATWVETPPQPELESEMETPFSYKRVLSLSSEPSESSKEVYMARVRFVVSPLEESDEAEAEQSHDIHGTEHETTHETEDKHDAHNDSHDNEVHDLEVEPEGYSNAHGTVHH